MIRDDFDATTDRIEIVHDGAPPVLTTQLSDDGLTLLANGDALATFAGVSELDLTKVSLVAG
mgnify:CR=1 FL=1